MSGSSPEIVEILLQRGIDISVHNRIEGETALHIAVRNNKYQIVKAFVDANVNLDIVDQKGNTAVMVCTEHGGIQNMLINNGCSVNNVNNRGDTLLHIAVRNQDYNLAIKLLQGGCDASLVNNAGESAMALSVPVRSSVGGLGLGYRFYDEDARLKLIMTLFAAGESSKSFFDGTRPLGVSMVRIKNKQLSEQAIQYALLKQSKEKDLPSLYDWCTLQLRQYLVQTVNGALIFKIVDNLPLPKSVKEHVLLRDLAWRSAVI